MNSVIKYPGAKWSLAQWIISKFPPHHSKQILINIRLQVRERDLIGDFVNLLMLYAFIGGSRSDYTDLIYCNLVPLRKPRSAQLLPGHFLQHVTLWLVGGSVKKHSHVP